MAHRSILNAYRESQAAIRSLASIAEAQDGDTAWSVLEQLCHDSGFDLCGTGVISAPEDTVSIHLSHGTPYYQGTFERYVGADLHLNDPVAGKIAHGARFVDTEDALSSPMQTEVEGARQIKQLLREKGYSGHGVFRMELPDRPYAGWFGFAMSKGQSKAEFRDMSSQKRDLLMLGATAYTSVVLCERTSSEAIPMITNRESKILIQLAKGMTPQEIAEEEGRALPTIRHQIASARNRLGARSAAHAVALALQLGLIRF
ncbi:MAG: helix-turn-helix transcriptional regulator [Pseudomonadota bacterium]